jgi:aerobic C4-dicarboxylate transport protein
MRAFSPPLQLQCQASCVRARKETASVALVGTLSVVPTIPVAGMALILGIDRFMSEARALVNVIGNGVATLVIARHEGELDVARVKAVLDGGTQAAADPVEASGDVPPEQAYPLSVRA